MIIDSFFIEVKEYKRDYFTYIYEIKLPYLLKPGDYIYKLNYKNRGVVWRICKIVEATEEQLTLDVLFLNKGITKLKYNQEPLYESYGGNERPWGGEKRELVVRPFPIFKDRPNFEKMTNFDFYIYSDCTKTESLLYKNNFKNICLEQLSMF